MTTLVPRCGTCNAVFESAEAVRKHYESEYHLHNVRLRVEGQRPLTAQEFKHLRGAEYDDTDENGRPSFACKLCKKTFHSVQTLQAHVRSTAHLMKKEQRILARDSDAATALTSTSLGSAAIGLHRRHNAKRLKVPASYPTAKKTDKVGLEDREEDVTEERCLFCGLLSTDIEENLRHMSAAHEFTIPLRHHCSDVSGLLSYLARKTNGLICLVCGEKTRSFDSLEALRAHMQEKNHGRLVLGPEYDAFYAIRLDSGAAAAGSPATVELHTRGARRAILRREADVPLPRRREAEAAATERRAILAAEQEALAVARRERQEVMRVQNNAAKQMAHQQQGLYLRHQLKVSLRSNKLHPKGYDGEGQVN
ncbi:zinc finger protein, conserved [Trypanosoma theileri]|uniref:Zinc finger protein, conserved n=1 Tax=Trypanosoma theileri TaxID=67003 RepID=A0A1X0P2R4_9TRYP|nr:zinc finger protein, conserved [Trypanosoma theileri]ORC90849.1 zinc finger protein, conserved [Trypanosoma theileri]